MTHLQLRQGFPIYLLVTRWVALLVWALESFIGTQYYRVIARSVYHIAVCDSYISPYFFATCIQQNSAILFTSRLLKCKYRFIGTLLVRTKFKEKVWMWYRWRCTIFNSFGNALLIRYIYKGRLVSISTNIALLFYKEIYMKYLILYYFFGGFIRFT